MQLNKLSIRNYKSLRDVVISPSPLSILVGPNAAGKSNFADAVFFLSEVYSLGLETAVARKGGYENIAHRKQRRSKAPMSFEIVIDVPRKEMSPGIRVATKDQTRIIRLAHQFSVAATGGGIKAAFNVEGESFCVSVLSSKGNGSQEIQAAIKCSRRPDGKVKTDLLRDDFLSEAYLKRYKKLSGNPDKGKWALLSMMGAPVGRDYSGQELFIRDFSFGRDFSSFVSSFKVYQFSTTLSRQAGVPTPNPSLSSTGENLPALVDWLQRKHPEQWEIVMSGMRNILPDLEAITVQYLHTKTLGLFFSEGGFGRPWSVEDVSDGTMHALSMLVAAADPRTSLLLIEEPENSVHPWILRVIVDRLREVSKSKNVILTSHSPTLTNRVKPEELWVIYRKSGESFIQRLTEIDPSIKSDWENGEFQLAEFLDSGAVGQAVPGGVW